MQYAIEGPACDHIVPDEFFDRIRSAKPIREPGTITLRGIARQPIREPGTVDLSALVPRRPPVEIPPTADTQTQLIQTLLSAVRHGGGIVIIL